MPLFARIKKEGVEKLIDAHLCPYCVLRYCNVDNREIYLKSEEEVMQFISDAIGDPKCTIPVSTSICPCCFGILRRSFFDFALSRDGIKSENPLLEWLRTHILRSEVEDITEYYIEVSNLTSLIVRHFSMINYLVLNYSVPMEIIYNLYTARDVLKMQIENAMREIAPNAVCVMNSSIRIRIGIMHLETSQDFLQIPGTVADEEDLEDQKAISQLREKGVSDYHDLEMEKLNSSFWFNSSLKKQAMAVKLKQNTPPNVEGNLKRLKYTEYPETIQCPPLSPSSLPTIGLSIYRCSIYVTGNYLKLQRGLSQSPWVVDGERKTEGSVEEYILAVFKSVYKADSYKFHSAGREDVDVRMLHKGRPFVVEMENSKRHVLSNEEYKDIENRINNSTKEIRVVAIRNCSTQGFETMKDAAENKLKRYVAVIYTESVIDANAVNILNGYHDIAIKQKTPVRVLHRRSLLVRDKMIKSMKATYINPHHFILEIEASGGTYIKEFVHGDLGRTRPNVGEILHVSCDILQLDVLEVIGCDVN